MTDMMVTGQALKIENLKAQFSEDGMDHFPVLEEGSQIEAEVIAKESDSTRLKIGEEIVTTKALPQMHEQVGEMASFVVEKSSEKQLVLSYIKTADLQDEKGTQTTVKTLDSGQVRNAYVKNKLMNKLDTATEKFTDDEKTTLMNMAKEAAGQIDFLIDQMTDEDLAQLSKEGLDPQRISLEVLSDVVRHNKQDVRQVDLAALQQKFDQAFSKIATKYETTDLLETTAKKLVEADLPVIEKHVDNIMDKINFVDKLDDLSMEQKSKLLKLEEDMTIGKVYQRVSAPISSQETEIVDKSVQEMVVKYLESENLPSNENYQKAARILIEDQVPITPEKLSWLTGERDLALPDTSEQVTSMVSLIKDRTSLNSWHIEALEEVAMSHIQEDRDMPFEEVTQDNPTIVIENSMNQVEESAAATTQARLLMTKIESIEDATLISISAHQKVVTLKALFEQQEQVETLKQEIDVKQDALSHKTVTTIAVEDHKQEDNDGKIQSKTDLTQLTIKAVEDKLNLERIRLNMSTKAFVRLSEKGVNIDLMPLEEAVSTLEETKEALTRESIQKDNVVQQEEMVLTEKTGQVLETLKEVEAVVEALLRQPQISLQSLKDTKEIQISHDFIKAFKKAYNLPDENLEEVLTQGITEEVHIEKTDQTDINVEEPTSEYTTLEKKPVTSTRTSIADKAYVSATSNIRRDMGDSILKIFDQIESTLSEQEIPVTDKNVENAKMLVRSGMPINEQNLLTIEVLQEKVNKVVTDMTPTVTLAMVKAGINPMEMTLDELTIVAEDLKTTMTEGDEEKTARLLYELENNENISDKQKETLRGVYRMISTIQRSKGGATGFVAKQNQTLNLNNLFEAAKHLRRGSGQRIERTIDDTFGQLESVSYEGKSVKEQVRSALAEPTKELTNFTGTSQNQTVEVQAENNVIELKSVLYALKWQQFMTTITGDSQEALVSNEISQVKEEPLEALTELMKNWKEKTNTTSEKTSTEANYLTQDNNREYLRFMKANPGLLRQMIEQKIPLTMENFAKTMHTLKEPFQLLNRLETNLQAMPTQERAVHKEALTRLSEDVLEKGPTKENMDKIGDLLDEVEYSLQNSQESTNLIKANSGMKEIQNFAAKLAGDQQYFQIPLNIGGQMTQLNFYMNNENGHGMRDQESMNVLISLSTENLGIVNGLMSLKGNSVDLTFSSSKPEARDLLEGMGRSIRRIFSDTNFQVGRIVYDEVDSAKPMGQTATKATMTYKDGHREWVI